jgi:hypothetical protein
MCYLIFFIVCVIYRFLDSYGFYLNSIAKFFLLVYSDFNKKKEAVLQEGTEKLPEIRKMKILKKERKQLWFRPF